MALALGSGSSSGIATLPVASRLTCTLGRSASASIPPAISGGVFRHSKSAAGRDQDVEVGFRGKSGRSWLGRAEAARRRKGPSRTYAGKGKFDPQRKLASPPLGATSGPSLPARLERSRAPSTAITSPAGARTITYNYYS